MLIHRSLQEEVMSLEQHTCEIATWSHYHKLTNHYTSSELWWGC